MPVSSRALRVLADALRYRRTVLGSRWRRLSAGEQALLVLAYVNKGETYTALAGGFGVGTTTVFRYVREDVDILAALAPTLDDALESPRRTSWRILLLRVQNAQQRATTILTRAIVGSDQFG
ncbi:helix-turn-helix domain-containing protein [Pseudonocardia spinosispora]|uniref:helix-turn-helix domain-containing protein n=1 Tax=Pseudonocardia spinosispora TaxID=103441 RepID=UPI000A0377BB